MKKSPLFFVAIVSGLLLACGPAGQSTAPDLPATPAPRPAATPRKLVLKPTPAAFETPTPEPTPAPPPRRSDKLTSEAIRRHQGQPGVVRLTWQTQSEKGSFAFNVMRASDPKGPFTPANPDPLLGAGNSSTQMSYEFFDTNVKVGDVFYYYIQQIDLDGTKEENQDRTLRKVVDRLNLDRVKAADLPTSVAH